MTENDNKHKLPDWHTYFINMLDVIRSRSKDPNTQTGCVIVTKEHNVVSTGYNSFPRGINDNIPERLVRPEKYKWLEHCDRNAIYAAARKGVALEGCIMYLTGLPCIDCSRAIIQAGIVEVVYDANNQEKWEKTATKYNDDWGVAKTLLLEGGIKLTPYYRQPDEPKC